MAEPQQPPHTAADNHNDDDVNVRGVLMFGVGLGVLLFVVSVVLWWLHGALASREKAARPPLVGPAAERPRLPQDLDKIPEPRLQADEALDLERQRASEETQLRAYGWVDRAAGVVQIPIERAMDLLAQPGALPARPAEKKK
jgi:hypothetical protein